MTTFPTSRAVSKNAGVDRVLVGGRDITWFRATNVNDDPTRVPSYSLIEPFAYGSSGQLVIPRTNSLFEAYGYGDLAFIKHGAEVLYQRVKADGGIVTDYRGIVVAVRTTSSGEFALDVNGELVGRANLIDKPPILIRQLYDLGSMVSYAVRGIGINLSPRFPVTGLVYPNEGGTTLLSWLQKLCALSRTSTSDQRAIMPTTWGGTTWGFEPKDTTTVDLTLFADGQRIAVDLVDDAAEQPNTIFGSGVSANGERWRNSKYPGFFQGPPPAYPIADGAPFGIGTTDADTINGDGITVLRIKLAWAGYLNDAHSVGSTYDTDVAAAVNRLRDDAGALLNGTVTTATWNALWDIEVVGYSTEGAKIFPLARTAAVRVYDFSSTGSIIGRNGSHVPNILRVDRTIDYGVCDKDAAARHAKSIIYSTAGHQWSGTITLNGIAAFSGEHDNADHASLTSTDLLPNRAIRPGMNCWLPYFDGGALLHISGVDVDPGSQTATLSVSSSALDIFDLTMALQRNQESRRNVYREWVESNRGMKPSGNFVSRDEFFGRLYQDVRLYGGQWNIVPVIMGQSGSVAKTDVRLTDVATEFCMAVFAKEVTVSTLQGLIGNPFSVDGDGLTAWEHENVNRFFENRLMLYVAGQGTQPCGYSWKKGYTSADPPVRTANPLVGTHLDESSWSYITDPAGGPIVYLAIYPTDSCTLRRGHLFYALEDDPT